MCVDVVGSIVLGLADDGVDYRHEADEAYRRSHFMRVALNISGLKEPSSVPPPLMSRKPMITIAIPTARRMKFIRSNAKFLLSISLLLVDEERVTSRQADMP